MGNFPIGCPRQSLINHGTGLQISNVYIMSLCELIFLCSINKGIKTQYTGMRVSSLPQALPTYTNW